MFFIKSEVIKGRLYAMDTIGRIWCITIGSDEHPVIEHLDTLTRTQQQALCEPAFSRYVNE